MKAVHREEGRAGRSVAIVHLPRLEGDAVHERDPGKIMQGKGSRDSLERQNKESFVGEDKSEVNLVSFVYVF